MPDAIPKTKEAAMTSWATDACKRIEKITLANQRVFDEVRRAISEGRLRGKTEKRLASAIERLEDEVSLLDIILLGPDVSQEERDEI